MDLNADMAPADLPIEDLDGDGEFRYGNSPEDITHDNLRRAGFAAVAVQAYGQRTAPRGEDMPTSLSDLLGDLQHLADALGLEWGELLSRADGHYEAEIEGDW